MFELIDTDININMTEASAQTRERGAEEHRNGPEKKMFRSDYSRTIHITVQSPRKWDQTQRQFYVDREIILSESGYIQRVIGNNNKLEVKHSSLACDGFRGFHVFVEWLHDKNLDLLSLVKDQADEFGQPFGQPSCAYTETSRKVLSALIKLWRIGEILEAKNFRNDVLQAVVVSINFLLAPEAPESGTSSIIHFLGLCDSDSYLEKAFADAATILLNTDDMVETHARNLESLDALAIMKAFIKRQHSNSSELKAEDYIEQ